MSAAAPAEDETKDSMPPSKRICHVDRSGDLVKALSDTTTPVATLQAIIKDDPRCLVNTVFENGENCLHFYVRARQRSVMDDSLHDSLHCLVAWWPAGLVAPNDQGSTPLHVAIAEDACLDLVAVLVKANPAAVQVADQRGRYPLELAVAAAAAAAAAAAYTDNGTNNKEALWELLVGAWPEGLTTPNPDGLLLLHSALLLVDTSTNSTGVGTDDADDTAAAAAAAAAIVSFLVQKAPQACQVTDNQGRLPLHLANPKNAEIYKCLIQAYPEALMIPNAAQDDSLALHSALRQGASSELVFYIGSNAPAAVKVADAQGRLPLQFAKPSDSEIYEYLINTWPESLALPNTDGSLPLHVALMMLMVDGDDDDDDDDGSVAALVQMMVCKAPDTVKVKDSQGRLPLALAYRAKKEVYECLVDAWPQGLEIPNEHGSLALHTVLLDGVNPTLVCHLVEKAPGAVKVYDSQGRFPLQLACEHCSSLTTEAMQALVDVWPESVQEKDADGNYPLHIACERYAGKAAIDVLVEAWPEALLIPNAAGNLPLHLLCMLDNLQALGRTVDVALWKSMTERSPESLQMANADAKCPVHLALQMPHDKVADVVKKFLCAAPETLLLNVENGLEAVRGTSIMHMACQLPWFTVKEFKVFVAGCPAAVQQTDMDGTLPLHQFMQYGRWYEGRNSKPIFLELVQAYPESLALMDQTGVLPLHYILDEAQEDNAEDLVYLESLVNLCPGAFAASSLDDTGELLLHKACNTASWAHRIPLILTAYPEAIQTQSAAGWNPLCLAIRANAPWETIDLLIQAWPESTTVQVNGTYPLLVAGQFEYSIEQLSVLMKRSLGIFKDASADSLGILADGSVAMVMEDYSSML
jgi:ankyrin repeat protein